MISSHSSSSAPLIRVAIPASAHRFWSFWPEGVEDRERGMRNSTSERAMRLNAHCSDSEGNCAGVRGSIFAMKKSRICASNAFAEPTRKRWRGDAPPPACGNG